MTSFFKVTVLHENTTMITDKCIRKSDSSSLTKKTIFDFKGVLIFEVYTNLLLKR